MSPKMARAFAPATVANVGVGFDILGFALHGIGEYASVEKIERSKQVILEPIEAYPKISTDPRFNTATAGLLQLIEDKKLNFGFRVRLEKNIPVGSGMGGSATSAVASIVAANALLKKKLTQQELLHYALIGEEVASGSRHGDNIGPCLQGGLNFVRSHPQAQITKIKTPSQMRCVLILPETSINTKEARGILKSTLSLSQLVDQTANLAGFLLGCVQNDFSLIRNSLKDVVIEPQRASLIPEFYGFQNAALKAGALGCSISGSGPAIFALAESTPKANKVLKAMRDFALEKKIPLQGFWMTSLASKGAHLVRTKK